MTADRLATAEDLASLLGRDDIDAYKAGVLADISTSVIQAAAGGQRIVLVTDDVIEMEGQHGRYLQLPQIPVRSVASVTMNGSLITDYKLVGNRLRRRCGWWSATGLFCPDPADLVIVCTHGYDTDEQGIQLGRGAVLGINSGAYGNPRGLKAESIDDYAVTYAALSAQLEATPSLKDAIRRQYGRKAGLVRLS